MGINDINNPSPLNNKSRVDIFKEINSKQFEGNNKEP